VAAFLDGRLGFLQIGSLVGDVMAQSIDGDSATPSLETIFDADIVARKRAAKWLENAK
jgi:1-deoxy-D-xylulose 5-phosphate reductoisomerase